LIALTCGSDSWRRCRRHALIVVFAMLAGATFTGYAPASAVAVESGSLSQLPSPADCVGEEQAQQAICATTIQSGLSFAYQLAVSPNGKNAYSVAIKGALVEYSRNPASGALTVIGCLTAATSPPSCASENEQDAIAALDSPAAIALSPNGESAYMLDQENDAIIELRRDPETGLLSVMNGAHGLPECISEGHSGLCETSTGIGLNTPYGIAVSPNGASVYVASLGSEAIAELSRNTETGTLEEIPRNECIGSLSSGCPVATAIGLKEVVGVVVSPSNGEDVYSAAGAKSGTEGDVAAFRRNESTGVLEQLEGEDGCIGDGIVGCAKGIAFAGSEDLTISPDGKNVYANSYDESAVVELSRETTGPDLGALHQLGGKNACVTSKTIAGCTTAPDLLGGLAGVAISPDGTDVYASSFDEDSVAAFARQPLSGELEPLQAPYECVTTEPTGCGESHGLVGLEGARRLTVSPDGTNVYVSGQSGNDVVELSRTVTPAVTGLGPSGGPTAGNSQVTIEGSGFADGARVDFGEAPASSVTVNSASSITATSPAGSGQVDVTVTNAAGSSAITPADVYAYGRLGGLNLSGYCQGLGYGNGAEVSGTGPQALDWVCVGSRGEKASISPAGSPPSMNNACAAQYPGVESHAVSENVENANSWNCYEGAPAPEGGGGNGNGGSGNGGGTTNGGATAKAAAVVLPPSLGVTANVAPISGTVLVRVPGSRTFVPLSSLQQIPFGTVIEATHGHVSVTTAEPNGTTQTGEFFEGEFILKQGRNGLVIVELTGGKFSVCPTARERAHKASVLSAHAASSGKHVVRKLWANAHGSFETKGNYAAGAVQGTEWLTEDLCEGTLIRVTRDKVLVTNLVTHHHVEVKVGHKYLAKAP
jgi:DNA-binding beta-propeller fold protein YncE